MPQMENLSSEKRRYPRIVTSIPMNLVADKRKVVAETIDLSLSGVCCRVDRPMEVMTCLEVVLMVPHKGAPDDVRYIECEGIVVRSERMGNGYQISIFFSELPIGELRKLTAYLAAHTASG